MNSSVPWAAESLADAAQSMASKSSPGWYGRELATSDPLPRLALCALPKASPISRRRGTSGKLSSVGPLTVRQGNDLAVVAERGLRSRHGGETPCAEVVQRLDSTDLADLDEEGRREQDPVPDHGQEQKLDVLGKHIVPPREQGPAAGGPLEREAAADRGPDRDDVELAGDSDEVDDPALEQLVHVHRRRGVLEVGYLFDLYNRFELAQRMPVELVADDLELVVTARVTEGGANEEAVELCLRQREGALELDRVLRREHDEGFAELAGDTVDRDLALGHRLEQRRLSLRHRAVDLVDEHDVGEDRSGAELEVACLLAPDREPGDVGGLEVGRALDARRLGTFDRLGDRPRQHGLGRPGNVLEEDVPFAGQRGKHELDLLALPPDCALDVVEQAPSDVDGSFEPLVFAFGGRPDAGHRGSNTGSAFIWFPLSAL